MTMPRIAIAVLLLALGAGCTMAPEKDLALERVRSSLNELKNDPELGDNAPLAVRDAEETIEAAELATNKERRAHLVYLAERQVGIARARAEQVAAREQIADLEEAREQILMEARIREAERARQAAERARMLSEARAEEAARARQEAEEARRRQAELAQQAQQARDEADAAREVAQARAREADLARQEAEALKSQVADLKSELSNLQTRETERGVVVTVGDVLFEVNRADLKAGAIRNLGKLVDFLQGYPDRDIRIEGHSDSTGASDYNLDLSQRRAESVREMLVGRGIGSGRITTEGLGEDYPVASNDSEAGRQQNRRVEIILLNPGVDPGTPPPESETVSRPGSDEG